MSENDLDFNPFAPPKSEVSGKIPEGVNPTSSLYFWREKNQLVVRKGAIPPRRCIKCNEEPAEPPYHKKVSWHRPFWFILVVLSLWLYILVYFFVRYKGEIEVSLCEKHKSKRRFWMAFSWILGIASLVSVIGGFSQNLPVLGLVGLVGILVAIVTAIVQTRLLIPTKMDESTMWFKGACPEYLDSLSIPDNSGAKPHGENSLLGSDIIG